MAFYYPPKPTLPPAPSLANNQTFSGFFWNPSLRNTLEKHSSVIPITIRKIQDFSHLYIFNKYNVKEVHITVHFMLIHIHRYLYDVWVDAIPAPSLKKKSESSDLIYSREDLSKILSNLNGLID